MANHLSILKFASLTCAIHCAVLPLMIFFAPTIGDVCCGNPLIEISLLIFSILCGVFVIYSGYCKHKRAHSVFLFGIGLLFWVGHLLLETTFGDFFGYSTLVLGTILVLVSYYFNHRFLNCCPH